MSYMYSLFNFVPSTVSDTVQSDEVGQSPYVHDHDGAESGLQGYTDGERRLVGISTVCVITYLALELQDEDVWFSKTIQDYPSI
jgi:phosphatidylinositol 4-kinase A